MCKKILINLTDAGDCDGAGCSILSLLALDNTFGANSPIARVDTIPVNRNNVIDTLKTLDDSLHDNSGIPQFPEDSRVRTESYLSPNDTVNEIILTFTDIPVNEDCMSFVDYFAEKCDMTVTPHIIDHHRTNTSPGKYLLSHNGNTVWRKENIIIQPDPCEIDLHDVPDITNFTKKRLRSATLLYYKWLISHSFITENNLASLFAYEISQYDTFEFDHFRDEDAACKNPDGYTLLMNNVTGFDEFINTILYDGFKQFAITLCDAIKLNSQLSISKEEYTRSTAPALAPISMKTNLELLVNIREKKYMDAKHGMVIPTNGYFEKYRVGLLINTGEVSYIGNRLCKEFPDIDFTMFVSCTSLTISMRTIRSDIDLSKIVETIGGGGHPKAAGAPITMDQLIALIKIYHENK